MTTETDINAASTANEVDTEKQFPIGEGEAFLISLGYSSTAWEEGERTHGFYRDGFPSITVKREYDKPLILSRYGAIEELIKQTHQDGYKAGVTDTESKIRYASRLIFSGVKLTPAQDA